VPLVTGLGLPKLTPTALSLVVAAMAMGPVYKVEATVGVLPSVV
jgi:hypothetical protein